MKRLFLLVFLLHGLYSSAQSTQPYVFFLHNQFLEDAKIDDSHPDYGRCEYREIIAAFQQAQLTVISEQRPSKTDARTYARKVVTQIDSLIKRGVDPSQITVVGTSKGGFIAMFVSSFAKNKNLNFVFVGCCDEKEMKLFPEIHFYGNILSIYEKSDKWGSCATMKNKDKATISTFNEIELNTGLKHGYLYKALDAWMVPAINWAKQKKNFATEQFSNIDSVMASNTNQLFNGIVIVSKNGATKYAKQMGFSNLSKQTPLKYTDAFTIGSISKQMTAVLVLREYEQGHLQLNAAIKKYLPALTQAWADSITVLQLLTHTHGIPEPDNYKAPITSLSKTLGFRPGTQFSYSQIGFDLLARIVEKTSGKNFATLSDELFAKCGMTNSYAPDSARKRLPINGYLEQGDTFAPRQNIRNLIYPPVAAGGFVSTVEDLVKWNTALHQGQLLADSTYRLMISKQKNAVRQHPVFGVVTYGLGITIDDQHGALQLGQTGLSPGFVSMDFYFPDTKTSVIVLSNVHMAPSVPAKSFEVHKAIFDSVKKHL